MKKKLEQSEKSILEIYLKEINQYPLLTEEEEKNYAIRKDDGDEYSKKKLIESNLRFVVNIAKRYKNNGVPLEDLINEGNIGLMNAVRKYDCRKGYHLISYAVWWIRQSILKYMADKLRMIRIPMNKVNLLNKIGEGMDSGYYRDIGELGRDIGMKESSINELLNISKEMISIDEPLYGESDSLIRDYIEDTKYPTPEKNAVDSCLKRDIAKIFENLPDKESEILEYRFGLNGKPLSSLSEIGLKFNLSKERIRQIEKKVLTKLGSNPITKEKLICYLKE
ncbi:MAG: RNA polymerase sigma factor RpoD/SigA [Candidatus Pacearchaeota archaeon]|nr:RNA polymerase sigma factor RpoD/SigA [Candidatus Pacearchaeota archaeon]